MKSPIWIKLKYDLDEKIFKCEFKLDNGLCTVSQQESELIPTLYENTTTDFVFDKLNGLYDLYLKNVHTFDFNLDHYEGQIINLQDQLQMLESMPHLMGEIPPERTYVYSFISGTTFNTYEHSEFITVIGSYYGMISKYLQEMRGPKNRYFTMQITQIMVDNGIIVYTSRILTIRRFPFNILKYTPNYSY